MKNLESFWCSLFGHNWYWTKYLYTTEKELLSLYRCSKCSKEIIEEGERWEGDHPW